MKKLIISTLVIGFIFGVSYFVQARLDNPVLTPIVQTLEVTGNTTLTGDLFIAGGTLDMTTSTNTTTPGIFSRDHTNSTSTISIGDASGTVGCLELVATDELYYNCYIDIAAGTSTALVCAPGRCVNL